MGFNTKLVAEKEAPKSWFDLLDPKWHGKIMIEILDYRLYAGWEQRLGLEQANKLAEGLARQKIALRRGASQIAELLAAGESPLAQAYVHHLEVLKAKGAPVEWIRTFDPLVALRGAVAISANAPHPNAARLFVDFYLSKEAQQIVRTWGKVPAHPEVDTFHKSLQAKDLKIHFLDPKLTGQNYAHYAAMAKKSFLPLTTLSPLTRDEVCHRQKSHPARILLGSRRLSHTDSPDHDPLRHFPGWPAGHPRVLYVHELRPGLRRPEPFVSWPGIPWYSRSARRSFLSASAVFSPG